MIELLDEANNFKQLESMMVIRQTNDNRQRLNFLIFVLFFETFPSVGANVPLVLISHGLNLWFINKTSGLFLIQAQALACANTKLNLAPKWGLWLLGGGIAAGATSIPISIIIPTLSRS